MKVNLTKHLFHFLMIAMALWKLNLLKSQMIIFEILHRH
jgi:hypothetical protein